jgi:hypothetical protein
MSAFPSALSVRYPMTELTGEENARSFFRPERLTSAPDASILKFRSCSQPSSPKTELRSIPKNPFFSVL